MGCIINDPTPALPLNGRVKWLPKFNRKVFIPHHNLMNFDKPSPSPARGGPGWGHLIAGSGWGRE
jgi:hypothetical protein